MRRGEMSVGARGEGCVHAYVRRDEEASLGHGLERRRGGGDACGRGRTGWLWFCPTGGRNAAGEEGGVRQNGCFLKGFVKGFVKGGTRWTGHCMFGLAQAGLSLFVGSRFNGRSGAGESGAGASAGKLVHYTAAWTT